MCPSSSNYSKSETCQRKVSKLRYLLLLCLLSGSLAAQEISPRGKFLADSIAVGEQVDYTLAVRYPKSMELLLPDSTWDYAPFELLSRKSFDTRSDSAHNYDSAVYTLTTFEVDPVLQLAIPVFILQEGDSIPVYPASDSIFFADMIRQVPDSVALLSDTAYREVAYETNWYLVAAIAIPTGLVLLVILALLIKPLYRRFQRKRFIQRYDQFISNWEYAEGKWKQEDNAENTEAWLLVWKTYMEKLEGLPYLSLTTKELGKSGISQEVFEALRQIDRKIYGGSTDPHLTNAFGTLREHTKALFHDKLNNKPYA